MGSFSHQNLKNDIIFLSFPFYESFIRNLCDRHNEHKKYNIQINKMYYL